MEYVCKENKCNGCMACIDKCPKKCISINDNLFSYNAVKNMELCINCNQCENVCPNNTKIEQYVPIDWKQGWAEWKIRGESSSGGVASAIIASFIESGGYVASCLFREGRFVFDITNDTEIAKKYAGSKYVKSNPEGIYTKIQERIKTDKVLFIGLPCQVAGIKNYIKNQENLYTIDLICHGTPSPKVLERFFTEKKIDIQKCSDIKFRRSNKMGLVVDKSIVTKEGADDYLITFLDAISYTENCYDCKFATTERVSDITLGDSWGTEYVEEEKNGVSLILMMTEKGRMLVNNSDIELRTVNINNALKENHQLRHPSIMKPERNIFLNDLSRGRPFSSSTFRLYKKIILKRYIKKVVFALHLKKNKWIDDSATASNLSNLPNNL